MNSTRLYLYDKTQESNGYRGTDLSAYIMQGDEVAERLNNELDTASVSLAGYSQKEGFAPTTKMIMDKVVDGEVVATYHWMVDEDIVAKPILSDDTYYDHRISLIEPSVVAQKRPVDNISVTYKLKDVSLQTVPAFDTEEVAVPTHRESKYTPDENFSYETRRTSRRIIRTLHFGKYFVFDGEISFNNGNLRYAEISADGKTTVSIAFPKVQIYFGEKDTKNFSYVGDASLDYSINEYNISDQSTPTRAWTGSIITNSAFPSSVTSFAWECYEDATDQEKLCFLPERTDNGSTDVTVGNAKYYAKKYTDTSASSPVYTTSIDALPDKIYTIRLSLHDFGQKPSSYKYSVFSGYPTSEATTTRTTVFGPPAVELLETSTMRSVEPIQSSMEVSFQTYSESTVSYLYQSSLPYTALDLIAKAVTNSGIYPKLSGVCIGDINARDASGKLASNLPFYIDPNFVNELANTQVIENFYSQKNLWEILVEAGNYIHAVPEIKFGEDDRFMITFSRLGETDEKTSANRPQNIINFRGVQDYISSVSSYITNMVQLGGQISEWVPPKTTSEQYLVYNDTISIVVSKPITEILSVIVKCNTDKYESKNIANGATADMTRYVFEENVYKVIDIDPTVVPNKGIAIYYSLGDNVIKGCDFRTPTSVTGAPQNDYAIKKIIYSAFKGYPAAPTTSPWSDIVVNDFTFLVTYRTKDSVRISQIRPDIRKYLTASKFDKYPINGQFNNQEDILVDSVKFGLNVYGKLIRTGNTEYTVTEWCPDWSTVRKKGDLYRINGDLYYATRVHSVSYAEHIESEVTFSKDFNALSSVVGIPSEPRFYEISEQSAIRREVEINDILYLTTNTDDITLSRSEGYRQTDNIYKLIFTESEYAKYVVSFFKGDADSAGRVSNVYGEPTFSKSIISPLSSYSCGSTLTYTWDMVDNYGAGDSVSETESSLHGTTAYRTLQSTPYTDVYGKAPLLDFCILSDLSEDMSADHVRRLPDSWISEEDDFNIFTALGEESETATTRNLSLRSKYAAEKLAVGVRICLRATDFPYATVTAIDIENFNITVSFGAGSAWGTMAEGTVTNYFYPTDNTKQTIRAYYDKIWATNIPVGVSALSDPNKKGLQLFKDNREAISINYNTEMATSSDQFVVSPWVFSAGKKNVKIVLLADEVNKITDGFINTSAIIFPRGEDGSYLPSKFFDFTMFTLGTRLAVYLSSALSAVNEKHFSGADGYSRVKSIAFVYDLDTSGAYRGKFIFARNIPEGTSKADATANWYLGTPAIFG